jgi:hypothetical protein
MAVKKAREKRERPWKELARFAGRHSSEGWHAGKTTIKVTTPCKKAG